MFQLRAEGILVEELIPEVAVSGALELIKAREQQTVDRQPCFSYGKSEGEFSQIFFIILLYTVTVGHFPAQALSSFNDPFSV